MAYYYSLRGWLEVGDPGFRPITRQLQKLQARAPSGSNRHLYLEGWTWTERGFNGTGYVFYGGMVQQEGLDWLEEVLTLLTGLGYCIHGYFHAAGEDRERNYHYQLRGDDRGAVNETAPLYEELAWTTERLFREVRQQQTLLRSILHGCSPEQLSSGRPVGRWTVNEILAHLTAWNQRAVLWLQQMRQEQTVTSGTLLYPESREHFNQEVYMQARARNVSEILAEWQASQQAVLNGIRQLPAREWSGQAEFAWLAVYEITVEHYQEHRAQLMEGLDP